MCTLCASRSWTYRTHLLRQHSRLFHDWQKQAEQGCHLRQQGADVIDPGDRCMEHMCVGLRRQMVGMRGGRGGQSGVSGSGSKRAYPRGVPRYPFIPSLRPGNHRTCIRLVNKLKVSCLPTRDTMDSHLPSVVVYEHFLLVSIDI
jgi:hypothetical protein